MYKKLLRILSLSLFLVPSIAAAVTQEDFLVKTTQNLLNLCTVSANDPMQKEATHMCSGYLVGAFHYHEAAVSALGSQRLVCLPEKAPSRNEAIAMFVEWAKARPQYLSEMPVETEFRFLMERWPCKKK